MALNSAESKTQFTHKQIALRVALGLMVLAITILLILNRDKVQALQQYGYTGIFLFPCFRTRPFFSRCLGWWLPLRWELFLTHFG